MAQRQVEAEDRQATELWDASLHRLIAQSARNRHLITAYAILDPIRSSADWMAIRARSRNYASIQVSNNERMVIIEAIGPGHVDAARQAMRDLLETRSNSLCAALEMHCKAEN
ncbi:FCD domain-containing protein [Sulfitobacter sp.]|uniref:FCD domain-containing protein n=1 Tax=Sulfitobacter sp. TaxID=1903071 RepID=UPI003FCCF94F